MPVPEPGIDDVLIRIRRAAICGTDVHIYTWDPWAQRTIRPPLVLGHEFAGEVAAFGANVKGLKEGEVVSGEGHITCGHCRNCLAGRRHLCANPVGRRGESRRGIRRLPVHSQGQRLDRLPARFRWTPSPTSIPLAMPRTRRSRSISSGEDVLITGAGPVGLMSCAIAKHAGARHVVVSDINPYRVELAKKMGADLALNARTHSVAAAQEELGMKEGFDVGLEMSGSAEAFRDLVANMYHGGKVALLGLLPSDAWLDWTQVIFNSLTLKGIYGREMFETWYKVTAMLQSGLDVSPVLTHRFPVGRFEEGFEVMRAGECGKVVIDWADVGPTDRVARGEESRLSCPPPADRKWRGSGCLGENEDRFWSRRCAKSRRPGCIRRSGCSRRRRGRGLRWPMGGGR